MITVKSLEHTTFDDIYEAFSDAFSEYVRTFTYDELKNMITRRGYVSELSFAAFDGDRIASFLLNGAGVFNGKQTIYDTGTGTVKTHRGQGLAGRVFKEALPYLKAAGFEQYVLEVLTQNAAAIAVYRSEGFNINRELNYFVGTVNDVIQTSVDLPDPLVICEMSPEPHPDMQAMWDFEPSWQNSHLSLLRNPQPWITLGIFNSDKLVAYGIIEIPSGDIPQLAVHPEYRRRGLGSLLLQNLLKHSSADVIKILNTDKFSETVTAFNEAMNIPLKGAQYEMIKTIQ